MHLGSKVRVGAILLAAFAAGVRGAAPVPTWETLRGERFEGSLTGVFGTVAMIAGPAGNRLVSVGALKDAELGRVADYLAARPATAPAWAAGTAKITRALQGRLQVLRDGKLVAFQPGPRAEPEFYLVYFGADWCPPCRAFSPKLVEAYAGLKQLSPEGFEVVFVSSDRDSGEQLKYVRHVGMPWPVLKFSQVGNVDVIERWAGRGIPCLVALTRNGEVLFHSYHGTEYVGPGDVLQRFEVLLRVMRGEGGAGKRELHRLAVLQHGRAAAGGDRPVQPYLISMDMRRYQTLERDELIATLQVEADGTVTRVTVEPTLPVVLEDQFLRDAETWLFLPGIRAGQAQRSTVALPLKVR